MTTLRDDGGARPSSLSGRFSPEEVSMAVAMRGFRSERAKSLARLCRDRGNWNDAKRVWYQERLSNRSTRGRSRNIYRVLRSRFQHAPPSLSNPADLGAVFDACTTARDETHSWVESYPDAEGA
ncbi:hypothetical protein [Halorussus ruber]|uniref:hypothetical protein n=1 Tax=Halorussus ruber TaxID=1126238 RepID=UPI00109248F5|nr:hypothetical protein [Halorussus ruber]